MTFKRGVQRYGRTVDPETPYQRAGQLWDERIGSARVQARNWRLIAFGTLAISTALSGALIWQSLQSRVVPYVVAVDRLGEARAVTKAEVTYQPTDPQIAWHLARFIEQVRSVSLDPVLMRKDWLSAYGVATPRGATFLGDYARSAEPFARIGDRTVSVQVTSVVRASDRSFQVKWTETAYERGHRTGVSHWTGILTIKTKPPGSVETLRKNPLGIYVDAIDWSREIEPAVPDTAPPIVSDRAPRPAASPPGALSRASSPAASPVPQPPAEIEP
ncbi:conjugal transfer protein TrbF [Hephaestia sp. GCM10023244]|uniref:conjugal transfer protein TrbF n=1 Tax=unclassified Hephaestia TaxID=2631281 RepID=UPI0020775843|nr:conjugal transfer protein TrbF [Hephaestia sp. MAHUQ-44]MCM8732332.1 conjugal transfer protein TrbF [Hephaestia sp. MAHUQ-44]